MKDEILEPSQEWDTSGLMDVLKKAEDREQLQEYLTELSEESYAENFADYFLSLPAVKAVDSAVLIRRSGIERTYYYQLTGGRRRPGRDKVLLLCLAAGLSLQEIQRALEKAGIAALYPKNRRDAVLIFAIEQGLDVMAAQELLQEFGLPCLA